MKLMNVFPFCLSLLITTALFVNELFGPALLAVALAVMAVLVAANPRIMFVTAVNSGVIQWLILLLLGLSTLWSGDPAITFRAAVQVGLTILLAICLCSYARPIHLVQSINIVCGVIVIASLISGRRGLDGMTGMSNLVGITNNKNTLSSYAGLLVLSSITILATPRTSWAWKSVALLAAPIGFLTTFASYSVAVIFITIVATTILVAINLAQLLPKQKRRDYIEQMISVGFIVIPVGGIFFSFFWDDALRLVGKEPTLTGRTVLWFYADRFSRDHYLIGVGFADFWVQGKATAEFLWRMLHIDSRSGFHFHNIYYQFSIELGVLGVILLVFYQIFILRDMAKSVLDQPNAISAFQAAFVIFLTIEEFQGVALFQTFSPLFFTCVACVTFARMARHREIAGVEGDPRAVSRPLRSPRCEGGETQSP
ncbi:O-antigen ligase family protein [Methylobacterium sp. BTF04]|uniref:O-antigen ligase family protein n=1 Tax=Methylobacterium sp. BTF04 TaxID=2708300 RepID=UPI0013CFD114|nr:O-antigen ligase family protein [Methylobacterium sp. BTF04]NEU14465.1 O-antigen ligase family protein [Methylobacterium sp. BTF04]